MASQIDLVGISEVAGFCILLPISHGALWRHIQVDI
jgi:hypothetical protein